MLGPKAKNQDEPLPKPNVVADKFLDKVVPKKVVASSVPLSIPIEDSAQDRPMVSLERVDILDDGGNSTLL